MSDDRKINALFVVPSLWRGGAETQLVNLINGIDANRFNKYMVCFEPGLHQLDRLDKDEVEFFHFERKRKIDISVIREIARVIDENDIDVVHCTLQMALLMSWLALRISRRSPKLIVAVHTTIPRSRKDELINRFLYARLMRACAKVIFVCKSQAEYWIRNYSKLRCNYTVIYNGVDLEYFNPENFIDAAHAFRVNNKISDDAEVIACIAGFRKEKGHAYLIKAFSRMKENVFLVLAGDGVLRSKIEQQIEESGVSGRIVMLGEVDDVRPVLAASDVTVIASTAVETFSIAVLESLAMAVPVVATDIGGLKEAVQEGVTGAIVKPGNPDNLREGLSSMLGRLCSGEIEGINVRNDVSERFDVRKMILDTENVLTEIVSQT